jgi:hypothetical protein
MQNLLEKGILFKMSHDACFSATVTEYKPSLKQNETNL